MKPAKTIQIFLPDGNPRGMKISEITNRTIQTIFIPRANMDYAISRNELKNVGVYFLIGQSEDEVKPVVYIGESEDCAQRLSLHNRRKDFWQYALVAISKTKTFTKSHVKYLEWHCIEQAKKAARYRLENDNTGKKPHISEPVESDLLDNFNDIKLLTSTLGYKVFDPIEKPADKDMLYCKAKGAVGKGQYTEDGFIVFKGSTCSLKETKGFRPALKKMRTNLIDKNILTEKGGFLLFTEDYTFSSPSTASTMITGNATNGWDAWKNKTGKTLDQIKRQG